MWIVLSHFSHETAQPGARELLQQTVAADPFGRPFQEEVGRGSEVQTEG